MVHLSNVPHLDKKTRINFLINLFGNFSSVLLNYAFNNFAEKYAKSVLIYIMLNDSDHIVRITVIVN